MKKIENKKDLLNFSFSKKQQTKSKNSTNSPLKEEFPTKSENSSNSPLLEGWQTQSDGVFSSDPDTLAQSDGVFKKYKKLPYNPKLKERAKNLRKAGNLSEVLFWNQVKRKKFLSLDFHRQKIIGNYIVDFYCPALDLVVEIDGESHNFKVEYDRIRENYLKNLGLNVVHFDDIDVKKNLNGVIEYLKEYCEKLLNTPSLRDTLLKEGNSEAIELRDTSLEGKNKTPRLSAKVIPLKEGKKKIQISKKVTSLKEGNKKRGNKI